MKDTVNIGIIGCGTVGRGVVKLMEKHLPLLEEKAGARLRLVWVCDKVKRSLRGQRHHPRFTTRWQDVVQDASVDVVVELMGGYEPARTVVLAALGARKHVATANKALLAKYWGEMHSVAQKNLALLYFEASVGGGIPVVQGLNEGLAANHIERIYGILNGTTNYILSRMYGEGMGFKEALKEAQSAGFAEADPTFDIEGLDAAHKIAILASIASGAWVQLDDVYREGLSRLDVWDVTFAREKLGRVVKLLGIATLSDKRFSVRVHPTLIPAAHPFASVAREYNAIFVHGDPVGDVMFYGKGAGQMAAASAVVSDIIYLARHVANGTAGELPYVAYSRPRVLQAIPMADVVCRHYLRFTVQDRPGVLSRIAGKLGQEGISIASVHQEDVQGSFALKKSGVPIVLVTHPAREGTMQRALMATDRLSVIRQKTVHLRMEDLQ